MSDVVEKLETVVEKSEIVEDLKRGDVEAVVADAKAVANEVKDIVVSALVTEVDGRKTGCVCGEWNLVLQMTRVPKTPAQTKPEAT